MQFRALFVAGFLAVCAAAMAFMPRVFSFTEYLFQGGEKIYVILPIMGALLLGLIVVFQFLKSRFFDLFLYFIIALPLISTLHRRLELTVRGAEFFLETFLVIGFTLVILFVYRKTGQKVGWIGYALVMLLAASFISASLNQSLDFRVGWFSIQEHLLPFCFFLITLKMVQDKDDAEKVIRGLLYSVILFSVLSIIWVFVLGQTIAMDTGQVLTAQTRINSGFRRLLVGAGFVTGNVGNRAFLIVLPIAVASLRMNLFSQRNLPAFLSIFFSLYFVIASEHRAALMATGIVFLLFIFFGRTRHVSIWVKMLVLGGVLFLFRDTIMDYLSRRILLDQSLLLDNSAKKRFVMWQFAMSLFKGEPLVGIGPLQYLVHSRGTIAQAITAHNYYINLLAELGLFGFISYMGLVLGVMLRGVRNYRVLEEPFLKRLSFGILLGLMGYQFALFFAGGRLTHNGVIYIHSLYWVAAGVLWVLPSVEERKAIVVRKARSADSDKPGHEGHAKPASELSSATDPDPEFG